MTTSPFGGAPASGLDAGPVGPFEAAALARSPFDAAAEPFGADPPPAAAAATPGLFGAVPTPRPPAETAEVLEPAGLRTRLARPERPSLGLSSGRPDAAAGKRRSPLLVIALGGGALVAGALVAVAVLGPTDEVDAGGSVVVVATTATPGSSATPSTGPTPATPSASASAAGGTTALGRDPFVALVAPVDGAGTATSGATPDPVTTSGTVDTSAGTGGSLGSSLGGSGSSVGVLPVPQTTVTVTAAPAPSAAPLTTAQTCSAVAGPMTALEQLLTSSTTSATGPVDTGTALRTPVGAMRSAVSASGDAALASRLDVATSSAEALRSQLLAGVGVTADQLGTQTSLDAAVRTACA